ncbi:hypothetical protein GWK47_023845 [Chionoecetes opilio]|uniref:Uncharacterized protein n=1 Tax=Chionoecetes opilio TaxID=41210 RepID=A0A8J4XW02_CHIOP|nr:hypothetical protein GWK47_023845 [Chionoecetes opilio]
MAQCFGASRMLQTLKSAKKPGSVLKKFKGTTYDKSPLGHHKVGMCQCPEGLEHSLEQGTISADLLELIETVRAHLEEMRSDPPFLLMLCGIEVERNSAAQVLILQSVQCVDHQGNGNCLQIAGFCCYDLLANIREHTL